MISKKLLFLIFSILPLLGGEFLEQQRATALKEKKLILLTVTKENCPYCLQMHHEVFENAIYNNQLIKKFIHVNIDRNDSALPESLHVKYFPTNLILSPKDLHVIDEFIGYMKPEAFLDLLDEVYSQEITLFSNTVPSYKKSTLQK